MATAVILPQRIQYDATGNATFPGNATLPAGGVLNWTGRSQIQSTADGYVVLENNAGTGFTGLRLGGTTSSFPMLKVNGTGLEARLADDSADTTFQASNFTAGATGSYIFSGGAKLTGISDGVIQLTNNAGSGGATLYWGPASSSGGRIVYGGSNWSVQRGDGGGADITGSQDIYCGNGRYFIARGTNGSYAQLNTATYLASGLSGASVSIVSALPVGSVIVAVTARVTTTITGATSWSLGDGTTVAAFASAAALASGTTTTNANWTITNAPVYAAATNLVITANGSNFTAGAIRVSVSYFNSGAPTS